MVVAGVAQTGVNVMVGIVMHEPVSDGVRMVAGAVAAAEASAVGVSGQGGMVVNARGPAKSSSPGGSLSG